MNAGKKERQDARNAKKEGSATDGTPINTDEERQILFLPIQSVFIRAPSVADLLFCSFPGVPGVLASWRSFLRVHPFLRTIST
jgi:hypothetical protein